MFVVIRLSATSECFKNFPAVLERVSRESPGPVPLCVNNGRTAPVCRSSSVPCLSGFGDALPGREDWPVPPVSARSPSESPADVCKRLLLSWIKIFPSKLPGNLTCSASNLAYLRANTPELLWCSISDIEPSGSPFDRFWSQQNECKLWQWPSTLTVFTVTHATSTLALGDAYN